MGAWLEHVAPDLGGKIRGRSTEKPAPRGARMLGLGCACSSAEEVRAVLQTRRAVCYLRASHVVCFAGLACTSGREEPGRIHFCTPSATSSLPGLRKCLGVADGGENGL